MSEQSSPMSIIGAASGLGAPDPRCATGPQALWQALQQAPEAALAWHEMVAPAVDADPSALPGFLARLADSCAALLRHQRRIAVVGGDHACAMGTWPGVARDLGGPLGLIWIDAHLDAHTPASSPSGNRHGMPVAALLGQLPEWSGAVLEPQRLCLVGVRSFEGAERELLQRLGVRVITMDEIGRIGIGAALDEAQAIASRDSSAWGVSIDLDAFDPADAPGVGTPVVGGLRAAPLLEWLGAAAADPRLRCVEVVEFNPVIDVQRRTLALLLEILTTASGADHESDH